MPKESIFEVQAQEDFVEKLAAARPAQALAELVWNGLDAEATKVSIEVDRGTLASKRFAFAIMGTGLPLKKPPRFSLTSADRGSGPRGNQNTVKGCSTGKKVRDVSVRSRLAELRSGASRREIPRTNACVIASQ